MSYRHALRAVGAIAAGCAIMSAFGCGGEPPEEHLAVVDVEGEIHILPYAPGEQAGPGLTVREEGDEPAAEDGGLPADPEGLPPDPTPPGSPPDPEVSPPCAPRPDMPRVVKHCRGGPRLRAEELPPPGVPFYVIDVACP